MNVHGYQLHSYVKAKFSLSEQALFDLPEGKRTVILNAVFEHFGSHRLFRDGLRNTNNHKDRFDNYRSYTHIKSFEMLAEDITITKQKSKNKLEIWKRKLHLAQKERFNALKRKRISQINDKVYKQKWEPNNSVTKSRIERLNNLKQKEHDKQYER